MKGKYEKQQAHYKHTTGKVRAILFFCASANYC